MDYRISWPDDAIADLKRLVKVIARDNPTAARRLGEKILGKVHGLGQFPHLGRVFAELGRDDVREVSVPPYRIVYRVAEADRVVTVLVIWHGAMDGPPRPPA